MRSRLFATLLTVVLGLTLSACGSSEEGPAAHVRQNDLVSRQGIDRYPQGSPQRAFLEFWSDLQYNSWADVAAYYDPAFREFIGTTELISAKKTGASVYPYLQPDVKSTKTDNGLVTINYTLTMEDGTAELASTTWRKNDGNWQLVFDSRLDGELAAVAEERVALSEDGGEAVATELPPSARALRAGKAAARRQAEFLAEEFGEEKP